MIWCAAAGLATGVAWWVGRPDDRVILDVRLNREVRLGWAHVSPLTVAVPAVGVAVAVIPSVLAQVAACAVTAALGLGFLLQRRAARRRRAREFRAEVGTFLRAWSGELRSGLAPVDAAHAAAGEAVEWSPVRIATSIDIPDALLVVADTSGGEALADAAAAWSIAEVTGAPLAVVLERVSAAVQSSVDVDREVAIEAAPARATARLMAALPIVGVVLGTSLGADPIGVLVGTGFGVGCLVAGLALAGVGVWWIERLVTAVET